VARSSSAIIPQQPKTRLYGRKAREMRRRDHTVSYRRSWHDDMPDGRAQIQANSDWSSQDTLTARQIQEAEDSAHFMELLYADEFPKPQYAPYSTESRGFTIIQSVETRTFNGRHYHPGESRPRRQRRRWVNGVPMGIRRPAIG